MDIVGPGEPEPIDVGNVADALGDPGGVIVAIPTHDSRQGIALLVLGRVDVLVAVGVVAKLVLAVVLGGGVCPGGSSDGDGHGRTNRDSDGCSNSSRMARGRQGHGGGESFSGLEQEVTICITHICPKQMYHYHA